MGLSITTDYARDTGDPSPYLQRIVEAGFTHIHWCHHWNTDFVYSQCEIDQVQRWLSTYGLQLLDLHGSVGPEKNWASQRDYERQAGVELVRNRIAMTAQLGGKVLIMHAPRELTCDAVQRSLDELEPDATARGVRIAIENTSNFPVVERLLGEYAPGFLGLCYDSGHGNLDGTGLDRLEKLKDRLVSVHLHDNDGTGDQHKLPFSGTVDWDRLVRIMGVSAYAGPVSLEVVMRNAGISDEGTFLARAFEAGTRLSAMVDAARPHA
jgi:sugar phosphate isomerase/epimerase